MTKRTFKTNVLDNKIRKFEAAAIEVSWKGAAPPENEPTIMAEYKKRRQDLWDYILEFIT